MRRFVHQPETISRSSSCVRTPLLVGIRLLARLWHLAVRNRLAIALASLVWLIFRSGSQPRRLTYPCQQVAAVNVSAFLAGLVPTLFLAQGKRGHPSFPRFLSLKRQFMIACIMFAAAMIGVESYQFAESLVPVGLPDAPKASGTPSPATVGIAQAEGTSPVTNPTDIEQLVRQAISASGGLQDLVHDGNTVVIKPNLVQLGSVPGNGIVTNVHVVSAVAKVVKEAASNVSVIIAEGSAWSDGGNSGDVTFEAFRQYGYDNDPQDGWFDPDPTVQLVDLNDTGGWDQHNHVTLVEIPNGLIRTQYWVPSVLVNCDVLISVPTLKNHSNGTVTLAMKNRVGCVPGDIYYDRDGSRQPLKRGLVHFTNTFPCNAGSAPTNENEIVRRTVVDLNLVRPQDFAVIDGLVGITNGPGGTNTPSPYLRLIAAGRDSVAVDSICTLIMGYNPDYVDQIAWADSTGALGTKNRAYITVLGDHVATVRSNDFPAGYADSVLCETSAPTLSGISLAENQQVTGHVNVTAFSARDNAGVIKAEVAVVPTQAPNLLFNGDFETGDSTGWTAWQASWSSHAEREFSNTEAGHFGDYCLKLGNEWTKASFGVYQQVTVEPGQTYRLDAYWKGRKYVDMNWWEVVLIDGPFSMEQADEAAYVEQNYMYAYDNNTYGLTGPIGTTFGWIWCHDQNYDQNPYPESQVDWNSRAGLRTATGNTMTVVLKAGSHPDMAGGVAAWFDNVSLRNAVYEPPAPEVVATTIVDPPSAGPTDIDVVWDSSHFTPGYYDVTVTIYDAALNENSITRAVEVIQTAPLIALYPESLTATTYQGGTPDNGVFTVTNGGIGTVSFGITTDASWLNLSAYSGSVDAGDPGIPITVYYDCASLTVGQHTATITVTDPLAGNSPQTIDVSVNVEGLSAAFSADVTSGASPLTVHFSDQTSLPGVTAWLWEFGDGTVSNLQNPSHTYDEDGTFTVRLTVTTEQGNTTEEETDYIQVADAPRVAFVGGESTPTTSDNAVISHLEAMGCEVDYYDDEPANRPMADAIASTHHLVVGSSTIWSSNVGGEFRNQTTPFIMWESALAWNTPELREAIADGGVAIGNQTQINVLSNSHPIMAGIPTGTVTLTTSGTDFSYCEGSIAPGAQVLATAVGNSGRKTMIAIEPGAQLLDGSAAAGKRAILFLYDTTWLSTNATGKQIFDNAIAWGLELNAEFSTSATTGPGPLTVSFTDESTGPATSWVWDFGDGHTSHLRNPTHSYMQAGTYDVSLTVGGIGTPDTRTRPAYISVEPAGWADFDADGDVDTDDCEHITTCMSGANLPAGPDCDNADLDADDDVDQQDFGMFQRCMTSPGQPRDPACLP